MDKVSNLQNKFQATWLEAKPETKKTRNQLHFTVKEFFQV
jgi:hypothetical protein